MNRLTQHKALHVPVLLEQVIKITDPDVGESYLDLTAGFGGHAIAVLRRTKAPKKAVLIDRDVEAIKEIKKSLGSEKVKIIHDNFYDASEILIGKHARFDVILADLGVSSLHLNTASRGFSFQKDGPLDMRMDQSQQVTAEEVVNHTAEAELARIITEYGEDPKAHKIARLIVRYRPIKTTKELANIIAKAWPGHYRIHPATRTFQALRITVNNELAMLRNSLPLWTELLNPGGRLAIISFQSLEDRIVKQYFQDIAGNGYDAEFRLLTKQPIQSDSQEIVFNPRARSAKLRAVVKINIRKGSAHADSGKKQLPNI